jgi:glyoxylase-like metal-dependent hydrolase (beta-lactamase superfamily II)
MRSGVPDLSVIQVKYGDRRTRKSVVYHRFADLGEPDDIQEMDYSFWVIRNDETVILVDTGYDIDAHDWLGEVSRTPAPEGLALLGIGPADVSLVIATHFHYDHVGYVHSFTNATIVASRTEYDHWVGKYAENGLVGEFATPADVTAIIRAGDEGRLRLIDGDTEVHPGVTVYPVGGHCPGQLLTCVESASGPVILASDAIHLGEQLEKGWAFFAHTDLDEMYAAIAFAKKLSASKGAPVIPGHDPRVRAEYPAVHGPAHEVATSLG